MHKYLVFLLTNFKPRKALALFFMYGIEVTCYALVLLRSSGSKQILSKCIEACLVRGKKQAIDSAYVKANASMDSIVEKEILDDADDYMDELNEKSEYKIEPKNICHQD